MDIFNSAWYKLGTKKTLRNVLSAITGIHLRVLDGADPESMSIAQRMSWASRRMTTRIEDNAYSLLGLFGIDMPMLYGEGERAFIRLQEEIIKRSDDQTIFAWSCDSDGYHGLLAKSPADFKDLSNVIQAKQRLNRIPYSLSNMGLLIELLTTEWSMDTYLAALDCELEEESYERIGILVMLLPQSGQFARVFLNSEVRRSFNHNLFAGGKYRRMFIKQKQLGVFQPKDRMYGFWVRTVELDLPPTIELQGTASEGWEGDKRIFRFPDGSREAAGTLALPNVEGMDFPAFALKLGFTSDFEPICMFTRWVAGWDAAYKGILHFMEQDDWKTRAENLVDKGKISTGLSAVRNGVNICITKEIINEQVMWVVDCTKAGKKHIGVQCDGCNSVSVHPLLFDHFLGGKVESLIKGVKGYLRRALQVSYMSRSRLLLQMPPDVGPTAL